MVVSVVAGPGLAADRKKAAIARFVSTGQPTRRTVRDDSHQRAANSLRDFRRHDLLRWAAGGHCRVVRRVGGEAKPLDRRGRSPNAVVQDDAHQFGKRVGAIAGGADRGAKRRDQVGERIAHLAPILVNPAERVLF